MQLQWNNVGQRRSLLVFAGRFELLWLALSGAHLDIIITGHYLTEMRRNLTEKYYAVRKASKYIRFQLKRHRFI